MYTYIWENIIITPFDPNFIGKKNQTNDETMIHDDDIKLLTLQFIKGRYMCV